MIEQGSCDLVTDLAGEMPSFVIADILGIPLDDGRELYRHTEALHSSRDAVEPGLRAQAFATMFEYSQIVWADKRANRTDDLASMLAHADIGGEELDAIDFFLWFLLLVDAGGDTTRNLVGAGMWALFGHPELEFVVEIHTDLEQGEGVEAQVVEEIGAVGDGAGIQVGNVGDDVLDLGADLTCVHERGLLVDR